MHYLNRESRFEAKVAIFLQDLGDGGAERNMLRLAIGLRRAGLDVELVLVREEGIFLSEVPACLRIVHLGVKRTAFSLWPLVRYLRSARPAVLMSALAHVNVIAILAAFLAQSKARVVITERNTTTEVIAANAGRLEGWVHRLTPWVYPRANRIVAVSKGVAEDLGQFLRLPPERIDVVYNPVVTPQLEVQAADPPGHGWFSDGGPPVVLAVGRLTRQKGFSNLLRAFHEMRRKHKLRLVILGEGPDRADLEFLVQRLGLQDCVDLPGFSNNPFALMARSKLFVLSSEWEGLPTVLVEALACGTPVVATDCRSGPREILDHGRYGRLVPVGDSRALAHAMTATLDNPLPRVELQQRAACFSAELAVRRYQEILRS